MTPILSRRAAIAGAVAVATFGRARAATPVLRLGDQKGGLQALLHAAGALENLPFRLEIAQFQAAAPLLEALNAGALDVAWAGDAPTTFALANGTPAHIVSAHRSNGAGTALLVKPNSPVRTVADLKGLRIGTSRGSVGHALVISALRAADMAPDAVRLAYLLPAEAKAALEAGGVDAWATWGVFVAQARQVDRYRVIVDGSHGLMTGLGYLVALDTAIAEKEPMLRELVGRAAEAARWSTHHVDDYAAYWANVVGVSYDVARLAFTTAPAQAVPIDAAVIADQQRTANLYTEARLINRHIDVEPYFNTKFNNVIGA